MNYYQIDRTNRYFETFQFLSNSISANKCFYLEHNENGYFTNYSKPNDKLSKPISESKNFIKVINDYFENNLFNQNEKGLLIYNLIPVVEKFGAYAIKSIMSSEVYTIRDILQEKYNIVSRGEITETIVLNEIEHLNKGKREIILQLIDFRKELLKEIRSYDLQLNTPPTIISLKDAKNNETPLEVYGNPFDRLYNEAIDNYIELSENIKSRELARFIKEVDNGLRELGNNRPIKTDKDYSNKAIKDTAETEFSEWLKKHSNKQFGLQAFKEFVSEWNRNAELEHQKAKKETTPTEVAMKQKKQQTFEDLFHAPNNAEKSLNVLRELKVIDTNNNYIGNSKGMFGLWIGELKAQAIIKKETNVKYAAILNAKMNGLNLGAKGSELGKVYKRITDEKAILEIKALLSKFSNFSTVRKSRT